MLDDIREVPKVPKNNPPKEKHDFVTPEEAATKDSDIPVVNNVPADQSPNQDESAATEEGGMKTKAFTAHTLLGTNETKRKAKSKFWHLSKKGWFITGGVTLIVLAAAGGLIYLAANHKPLTLNIASSKPKAKTTPVVTTVPSTLTGLAVAPSVNQRPITAVMIENTPEARPQSGLGQAGVVFEALAEGGVTRFMALFQDQLPTYVGPVRSARPYYIDWALGFDAPYAHVGGSPEALSEIQSLNVKDLDYMYYPSYYTRITSRLAPHNVYTSIPGLISLEASRNWTSSNFSGWPRKADAPAAKPTAAAISFNLSYSTYDSSFAYNPATNSYDRSEDGAPQVDTNTGKQLSPKVVIGMVVPWSQGALDSSNAYYSVYQDIGSGAAYVFQDGVMTLGQWSKASSSAPLVFTTANNQPLKLNAGQTWITAIASSSEVTY